jgi:IclR family mhp operon transcriptional activator
MSDVINPIVRALTVLTAMNRQPQCSLHLLHLATGIPKPTVHRLLQTLKSEGYVRSDVVKGTYSLTEKVRQLSDGYTQRDLLVEVAEPILMGITRRTGLPLAIGIREEASMVVRYSSMPYSPIGHENTTLGHSHDMLHSGMGQAYIAFCSETERSVLYELLRARIDDPKDWTPLLKDLEEAVRLTRLRGYGFRQPKNRGHSATMAVPVMDEGSLAGVVSLTMFGALLVGSAVGDCIDVLNGASSAVALALDARRVGYAKGGAG